LQNPSSWYNDLNAIYKQRQEKVFEMMDLLNCSYDPNQSGMFVWAKIPANYATGFALTDEILEKAAVFITPGGIFGSAGDGYIRTSLCAEVSVFEEAIQRIKVALAI
jgi:LL-diaminopimelate aminotransferase